MSDRDDRLEQLQRRREARCRQAVRDLGAVSFDELDRALPGARMLRVVCLPSFHQPLRLDLRWDDHIVAIELTVGLGPRTWVERAGLEAAQRLDAVVVEVDPASLVDAPSWGLDGMTVWFEWADALAVNVFSSWSPTPKQQPDHHRLLAAVLTFALEQWQDDEAALCPIEDVARYVADLPAGRVYDEAPRRLRLFGGLSSPAPPWLEEILDQVDPSEPLVIDLRNVDLIAGGLLPRLGELARRPGPTAWCATGVVAEQLEQGAGILSEAISMGLEGARATVKARAEG